MAPPEGGTDETTAMKLAEELKDASLHGKPTDVGVEILRGSTYSPFHRE